MYHDTMMNWELRIEQTKAVKYHLFNGRSYAPCMWCTTLLDYESATVEHLTPKSEGGPMTIENGGVACASCNNRRGTRSLDEFRTSEWLQRKREQVIAVSRKRRKPVHPDGTALSDDEIRVAADLYLGTLDKSHLIGIIMGSSKQILLDTYAGLFMHMNEGV